jgi:prolyl oligopeptidase
MLSTAKERLLYIETDLNAPNKRIVTVDVIIHQRQIGLILFPRQKTFCLRPPVVVLFFTYMKDAVSVVKQYDYSGKMLREIELPGLGSAGGFSGKKKEEVLFFY